MKTTVIAIDFDGTIVDHRFPDIGKPVPDAFEYMREFQKAGASLILYTMRSGKYLDEAIEFCKDRGIEFDGHNTVIGQEKWTTSPKCDADIFIDDNGACIPMKQNTRMGGRPYVAWDAVGPWVLNKIKERRRQ